MVSSARAALSKDLSSLCFPKSLIPIGRPFDIENGTDIDGIPVRLAMTVLMSTRNKATGSSIFSPILNGSTGTVGAIR